MGALFVVAGLALAALYVAWRAGAFPDAARRVAEATSPALLGAMPLFAAGFVAFGTAPGWAPGPVVGFMLLAAGVAVLAALVHGAPDFLVPPVARGAGRAHGGITQGPDPEDPRPSLETFFSRADASLFGLGRPSGEKPRSPVETQPAGPRPTR